MFKNAAVMILSILLCASARAAAQDRVILKVWELPDPKSTSPYDRADLAVVRSFQKKYPHIELRPFSGIQIERAAMDSRPLMAIAGGVSADVIYVNFRQSDTYIQNGFLHPLDEYFAELTDEEKALRIPDPAWPVIRRKGPAGLERVWTLPYSSLVRVLAYRKDLFLKAGLDTSKPPRDWTEFADYAKKLTDPSEGTYGALFATGPQAAYDWINFIWSAGGDAVQQGEDGLWKAVFDDDAAVDAMEFYLKLTTEPWQDAQGGSQTGYACREDVRTAAQLWRDGKIGMRLTYLGEQEMGKSIDPELYGVAPVPLSWNNIRGSELNCRMLGIFSKAGEDNNSGMGPRDPVQVKRAAWEFIRFFDSEEARAIRMQVLVSAGFGKLQNPIYLERYGYTEYLKYSDPSLMAALQEAMKNGKPEPYGKNCQRVYEFMTYPLEKCMSLSKKGELGSNREERRAKIKEILTASTARTNKEMIGYIAPEERARRNSIALLAAIFITIFFSIIVCKVWKVFTPEGGPEVQGWLVGKYFYAYLLLLPALGSILLWKYVPMALGSVMAFQNYKIVGDSEWIGLQNFADVLFDPTWWRALGKTFEYMFLMLTIGFVPPIVLAILLQEVSHGKVVYRIIYYLPAVITGVIVIYLWKLLYDPSDAGGLNQLLTAVGLEKKEWLRDESLAMLCCVLPTVWAGVGPGCLIYLAALKGIPDDIYEAADIDGASFFQKIRCIVVPHLKALIIIQFIASFIAASQQSGFILVMTFGGPNEATKVAGLKIFETAYLSLKFGMATTMAWMLGIILMGFTVIQLRHLSKMEFRAAGSEDK